MTETTEATTEGSTDGTTGETTVIAEGAAPTGRRSGGGRGGNDRY